jgi:hypothetical protein
LGKLNILERRKMKIEEGRSEAGEQTIPIEQRGRGVIGKMRERILSTLSDENRKRLPDLSRPLDLSVLLPVGVYYHHLVQKMILDLEMHPINQYALWTEAPQVLACIIVGLIGLVQVGRKLDSQFPEEKGPK